MLPNSFFYASNSFNKNSLNIYEKKSMRPVQQETIALISARSAAFLPDSRDSRNNLQSHLIPWRWNSSLAAVDGNFANDFNVVRVSKSFFASHLNIPCCHNIKSTRLCCSKKGTLDSISSRAEFDMHFICRAVNSKTVSYEPPPLACSFTVQIDISHTLQLG